MLQSTDSTYAQAREIWASAFRYQEQHAGMKVRTALTLAIADIYQLSPMHTQTLCQIVELFNTASLVHDDIIDEDATRRGAPSVWVKFGIASALTSGMYGYIEGLQKLNAFGEANLIDAALKSLEALHIGQHLDTQLSAGNSLPTLDQYRFIAQANTGCFFMFILDSCQSLNPMPVAVYSALQDLMLELAVYYRYINDYCDINHIPHFKKKGFAPDLEGGPKTFLMILANSPLIKSKRTDFQKRRIIFEWGNAGVFIQALNIMEDSFNTIELHFEEARRHARERNFGPLHTFLRNVHFQQQPQDNYYQSLLS
ncbi:polyprenyl synthetase family protein [Pseudomonas fitomaticsae]|uniref:Polyprenyl synthetase family protein n=1 Tax=Pseudomonas fitomaticsae TaxID=2837969 RepID=A0ABY3PVZ1_9PSED|nr:polyprenyl synthetase family protein [Pseudomonas fitomaticsae]UFP97817.1 polyprenyl synthetase family protein [Pseudomonas fitomaticsae]